MKVLFLVKCSIDKYGVSNVLFHLCNELRKRGIETVIFKRTSGDLTCEFSKKFNAKIYKGKFPKVGRFFKNRNIKHIKEVVKKEKIEYIFAHSFYESGYVAMRIAKDIGIPFIVTDHGEVRHHESSRYKRKRVQKRCKKIIEKAKFVTCLTKNHKESFFTLFGNYDNIKVIPNGIELESILACDSQSKNYILSASRFHPIKGIDVLVSAYAKYVKQNGQKALVLAGSGENEESLIQQINEYELNLVKSFPKDGVYLPKTVYMPGYVDGDIKYQMICEASCCVLPSYAEGFGLFLYEAIAGKKVIFASKLGSFNDILPKHMMFETGNSNDLASKLLEYKQNSKIFTNYTSEMFDKVIKLNWSNIADDYIKLLGSSAS